MLAAIVLSLAQSVTPAEVSYALTYRDSRAGLVSVRIDLPPASRGSRILVIPRAIPMGYGEQPFDRFVSSVSASSSDGSRLAVESAEGPRWLLGAPDSIVARIEYEVDIARMEQEVLAASDTSKARPGYLSLLGYSVLGYVEGLEESPVRLDLEVPETWPLLTTLAPRLPLPLGRDSASAENFYALADSQIVAGPELEVRALAQRSAEAAKQVKGLIGESMEGVIDGSRLVDEAAETIAHVAQSVKGVAQLIGEIAAASGEQSTGVDEINRALAQLERVTQQNAALVEQAAAAALAFEEEAANLTRAVGAFKTDRGEARERAIAFVKKGIAHLRGRDREAAFADFERRGGNFIDGDYYLWVCDVNGIVRCNGSNPKSRNQNHADLKDADGKLFIREVLRIAGERGKGWVDYQWRNPLSKQVEPKSTYFERTEDLIVLCGIYRIDNASAPRVLPAPHHATPLLR